MHHEVRNKVFCVSDIARTGWTMDKCGWQGTQCAGELLAISTVHALYNLAVNIYWYFLRFLVRLVVSFSSRWKTGAHL